MIYRSWYETHNTFYVRISYFDKFNSSWWEVTGVNKDAEVVLQQREDAVSNTAASLQQHQPLRLKLQNQTGERQWQGNTLTQFYTLFANRVWKEHVEKCFFRNWISSYTVVGVRWRCKEPETIKILYKKKHMCYNKLHSSLHKEVL